MLNPLSLGSDLDRHSFSVSSLFAASSVLFRSSSFSAAFFFNMSTIGSRSRWLELDLPMVNEFPGECLEAPGDLQRLSIQPQQPTKTK